MTTQGEESAREGPPGATRGRRRALLAAVLAFAVGLTAVAAWPRSRPPGLTPASTPATVHFAVIGDYGSNNAREASVAAMVAADGPDFVATVGDNAYAPHPLDTAVGQYYAGFIGAYQGTYGSGSATNRFFPTLGNHDISDVGGLPAYLTYFTLPGAGVTALNPSGNERYYDFLRGPVHFFVLDSDPSEPHGITSSSTQANWLRTGLERSPSAWNVVLLHHAPYSSSSSHGSTPALQWPFEAWGADLVLAGHDHTYERIVRDDDNDGTPLTYVVDGLGGQARYDFASVPVTGSQVRYRADYGALFVDATATALTATFRTIGGATPDTFTLTAPAAGHIVGTVTGGAGPVANAFVHAIDYRATPAVIRGDATDATGHYDIEVPAPDRYGVAVIDPAGAYAFEFHQDRAAINPADDVVVAPGTTSTVNVDLVGEPSLPGAIAGTVTNGAAPLAGAWVLAVSSAGVPTKGAVTDAGGNYTIAGLSPGAYKLLFTEPSGDRQWEYFDDATDWIAATAVSVTPGGTAAADAAMAPAP